MLRYTRLLILAASVFPLFAQSTRAADPIATAFVRGLSSGDVGEFVPVAADVKQLRERDWMAVWRVFDHTGCVDIRSFTSSRSPGADGTIEIRIDVDAAPEVPATWYITAVESAGGERIRAVDDDATLAAKRIYRAADAAERRQIVASSDASFQTIAQAFRELLLYSQVERDRGEDAVNDLLDIAAQRADATSTAILLTKLAYIKDVNHYSALGVKLAQLALAVAPYDAPPAVFDGARLTLVNAADDPKEWTCALDEALASRDVVAVVEANRLAAIHALNVLNLNETLLVSKRLSNFAATSGSLLARYYAYFVLGHIHLPLHNEPASEIAFRQSIAIAEQLHDAAAVAHAYFWFSVPIGRLHGPLAAIPALQEAERRVPPQQGDIRAQIVAKLGQIYVDAGRLSDADAIAAKPPLMNHDTISRNFYLFVCRLRSLQGRWEEAIAAGRQSLAAGTQAPLWVNWGTRSYVAEALGHLGRVDEAIGEYEESLDGVETRKTLVGTTPLGGMRYMNDKIMPYYAYADLLQSVHRDAEALKILERVRSYVLTEAMEGRALPTIDSGKELRRRQLESRLDAINRARIAADDSRDAAIERERDAIRRDLQVLTSEIALEHTSKRPPREWSDVLDLGLVLPDRQTAIVEYMVTAHHITTFVVSRGEDGRANVESARIEIEQADLGKLADRLTQSVAARDLEYRAKATRLEQILIRPIEGRLRRFRTLYIVPDSFLWRVPFQILAGRDGKMLIESHSITYASSIVMLRAAVGLEKTRPPAPKMLLAMGNPDGGGALAQRVAAQYRGLVLGDLPDAAVEVRALGKLYGAGASVYVGRKADEPTAKRLAPSYRILHFATHGVADDAQAMYSALLLAPSAEVGDDGLLEAREVAELHLNADLAVLSACQTAGGETYAGQGVIGIAWSFLIAGCPTTVVTHWNAPSGATTQLMITFHRHLLAGRSVAESLRLAELELRQHPAYAHPFYWANFFVIGMGRTQVRTQVRTR